MRAEISKIRIEFLRALKEADENPSLPSRRGRHSMALKII